jgi:hypothetical protein
MLCLLSALLSITCVQSQQNPSISFISKEQVVEIGDTLKLKCVTQYARDYPVHWIKENKENRHNYLFISKGSTINVPNSRYSIGIEDAQNSWSASRTYVLTIDKIQEIDSGSYSCQIITGSAAKVAAETVVIVRIPPIISDNSTRSVITTIGTTVDLFCFASGYPPPIISWRREKNKL